MKSLKFAVVALFLSPVMGSASPMKDYNLLLSGDFNVSGGSGHVEGKSFIGGDLINGSIFAQKLDRTTTEDTVEVVGNVTGNSAMHVEAGNLAYGGSTNVDSSWNGICNGAGFTNDGCFRQASADAMANKKASIFSGLASDANIYAGMASSSDTSISGDSNNKTFSYFGTGTDLAVFNIDAASLSNINWSLDMGSAENVLINVIGGDFFAGTAHVNNGFNTNFDNVLWNFVGASELKFGDSWYGSILALDADIYTNANLNGAIAAKSYFGNGEIHNGSWDYEPSAEVPETSSLVLFAMGIIALRLRRR